MDRHWESHSHFMKSECGVWARVEINSEPNKELRLTPGLASRMGGIVLAAVGAAAARRGKLPSSRETRITGGGAPRAPAKAGQAWGRKQRLTHLSGFGFGCLREGAGMGKVIHIS